MREIKLNILFWQGFIYRVMVICVNTVFCFFGVRQSMIKFGALGTALIWNSINVTLYYLYHYVFLRVFKIGRQ